MFPSTGVLSTLLSSVVEANLPLKKLLTR